MDVLHNNISSILCTLKEYQAHLEALHKDHSKMYNKSTYLYDLQAAYRFGFQVKIQLPRFEQRLRSTFRV